MTYLEIITMEEENLGVLNKRWKNYSMQFPKNIQKWRIKLCIKFVEIHSRSVNILFLTPEIYR